MRPHEILTHLDAYIDAQGKQHQDAGKYQAAAAYRAMSEQLRTRLLPEIEAVTVTTPPTTPAEALAQLEAEVCALEGDQYDAMRNSVIDSAEYLEARGAAHMCRTIRALFAGYQVRDE